MNPINPHVGVHINTIKLNPEYLAGFLLGNKNILPVPPDAAGGKSATYLGDGRGVEGRLLTW